MLKDAYNLFHEGSIALAQVEANGIHIDLNFLTSARDKLRERIKSLYERLREDKIIEIWRRTYGNRMNLGSREQLGRILFEKLQYPSIEVTASGRPKSDENSLKRIKLPFVKRYLLWEKLKRVNGTFLAGIERETIDSYLHPFFHLAGGGYSDKGGARSYRSSSSDPNFHNLPVRNKELSGYIRPCFIPRSGRMLVEMDYSGIEVRMAASITKDPVLLDYINDPTKDMHLDMAAECYYIKKSQVTEDMRYCGKNSFVFPEFYGAYYLDCARALWRAIDEYKMEVEGNPLKEHLKRKGITKLGKCDRKQKPIEGTFEYHIQQVERGFWGGASKFTHNGKMIGMKNIKNVVDSKCLLDSE